MKIECKTYKDFSWKSLFSTNKQLEDWISQAEDTRKLWFLTFKINYCDTCVVFAAKRIPAFPGWDLPDSYHIYKKDYIICDFETFFQNNFDKVLHLGKTWV